MKITGEPLHFISAEEWRAWLQANHAVEKEAWLLIYKKHAATPSVTFEEATEQALCFGWIDSILKRIDDEKHVLRYTPRRKGSHWSERMKTWAARLIEQGRMTEAGLAKIEEAKQSGEWDRVTQRIDITRVPSDLQEALTASRPARDNLEKLAPSYRRQFLTWIASAKTDATRRKRIRETIALLEQNRRLGTSS